MKTPEMRMLGVVITLAAIALPCGCSKSKSETQAATAGTTSSEVSPVRATPIADPCKLLTQAEASKIVGATLNPGETRRFGVVTRCSFFNRADPAREVLLDVQNETAPVSDSALFDSYTHLPGVQHVSGVGDQALWVHNEIDSEVDILKGGRLVEMKVPRQVATMTPAVEGAAKAIASRM